MHLFQRKTDINTSAITKKRLLFVLLVGLLTITFQLVIPSVIKIDICSTVSGATTLYHEKLDGSYWDSTHEIQTGCETISFDLLDYNNPILQLQLPPEKGQYLIESIRIKTTWWETEINLKNISARKQIEHIFITIDGAKITTTPAATDPQLTLAIGSPRHIAALHWGISFVNATFFVLFFLWVLKLYQNDQFVEKIDQNIKKFFRTFEYMNLHWGEFAALTGIAIALNLYALANFSISIDDEMAAFRTIPDIWLTEGRGITYLLERFVISQPVIPYAPHLFFSLSIVLAYIMLVRAHNLRPNWRTYLAFPVFGAFPIWSFMTEFYANLPSLSLGIVSVALAIFTFALTRRQWEPKRTPLWLLLQIIFITVAIEGYQSFILMYLSIGIGIVLFEFITNDQDKSFNRSTILSLAQLGIAAALSFALYTAINALTGWLVPTTPSEHIQSLWNLSNLIEDPQRIFTVAFLGEMRAYYSGAASKFGIPLFATGIIIILGGCFTLLRTWKHGWSKILSSLLLWMLVLMVPFSLNLVSGENLPTRSLLAIPYVVWLMAILLLNSEKLVFALVNAVIILTLNIQIVTANGFYGATAFVAQNFDRMLAADLYQRMSQLDENFDRDQIAYLDVYGTIHIDTNYPSPWSGTMGSSLFGYNWKPEDILRMVNFMKLMGYKNIQALEAEQRLQQISTFENMPAWPAPGSVQKIDDVFLIKLSENPDRFHAEFGK